MATNEGPVRYERGDTIAILTLDDGKANALGPDMIAAIDAGLDRVQAEPKVRALVLAGRPGRFCAGFDLKAIARGRDVADPMVRAGADLFMRIYGFPRPVIAACTGHALAGGALLLLTCDARIAARGPYKLGLNEVAIGIELPVLVRRLAADRIDTRRYTEAALLATVYDPSGAREVGFVDEVVEPDELLPRATARAIELARLPPGAFARSKAHMRTAAIEQILGSFDEDLERILSAGRPR
ncbi:MAG: crotonase/enoyl-CoA hydratase family protein [Myxococcota bacterium]